VPDIDTDPFQLLRHPGPAPYGDCLQ
jgi:hypothetical protein